MTSWVESARDSDFGLDNLPLGVFSVEGGARKPGAAIGDSIVDIGALVAAGSIDEPTLHNVATLNEFLASGRARWSALRARLQTLLSEGAPASERALVGSALVSSASATMNMPFAVQDYVDFYSSIEHATNVGKIFRPNDPLLPNYRHIPIGYHGRASTIVIDGTPIRRPLGQTRAPDAAAPSFGPARNLDFELELGFVTGPGNPDGQPIPIARAREHIYGFVLLDDWSARDIQAWEYQPLGPFLSKSFATSIAPWIVSLDALEPLRVANRAQEPQPLPYLQTGDAWAFDIELDVLLETQKMHAAGLAPHRISHTNFRDMYWHAAQQLAHLTSNGSIVRPGDLNGSGTISGTTPQSYGSLIELTQRGTQPLHLPSGEARGFLEDGDTVIMRGRAQRGAYRIGFGEVRGTIVA